MSTVTGAPTAALIDEAAGRALFRALRVMFPHEPFPDGPYERVRDGLLSDAAANPRLAGVLAQGVRDLDAAGDSPFADLDAATAAAVVQRVEQSEFFQTVKTKGITTLYNDPEVWQLLGYEGASFDQGGYVDRGFDDLDWLPEPPL
jgi:hypothetical protein